MLKSAALGPVNCIDLIILPTLPPDISKIIPLVAPLSITTLVGAENSLATRALPTGTSVPKTSIFFWLPPPRFGEPARVKIPLPETIA